MQLYLDMYMHPHTHIHTCTLHFSPPTHTHNLVIGDDVEDVFVFVFLDHSLGNLWVSIALERGRERMEGGRERKEGGGDFYGDGQRQGDLLVIV